MQQEPDRPGREEEREPLAAAPSEDSLAGQPCAAPRKYHRLVQALLQSLFVAGFVLLVFCWSTASTPSWPWLRWRPPPS